MTPREIEEVIRLHSMWLRCEGGGKRADLSRADLSGADLTSADLYRANLSRANLYGANLYRANLSGAVHAWAHVAFMGHGECGRMLTAVVYKEGEEPVYQCGCFSGSLNDLEQYIRDGHEKYAASRTYAMRVVTEMLKMPKP